MSSTIHSLRVDEVEVFGAGALGMIEVLCSVMGAREDAAELACVTSAALKTYVEDWEQNPPGEDGEVRYYSLESEYFSNYGVFESLGYATGWAVQEFNFLQLSDVVRLLAHELSAGRVMLTMMPRGEDLEPVALVGMEATATSLVMEIQRPGESSRERVDVWGQESLQGESEDFVNWCVAVRDGARPDWAASRGKLRRDMVTWLVEHGECSKEFFHETRVNYAPGRAGMARFLKLVEGIAREEIAIEDMARLARYVEVHVGGVRRGRRMASERLEVWADEVGQSEDEGWRDEAIAKEALRDAARAYGRGAEALRGVVEDAVIDLSREGVLHSAYRELIEEEERAHEALARAL